jgi:hypothetical protein
MKVKPYSRITEKLRKIDSNKNDQASFINFLVNLDVEEWEEYKFLYLEGNISYLSPSEMNRFKILN